MNVSVDQLLALIGELYVKTKLLELQLEQAQAKQAQEKENADT